MDVLTAARKLAFAACAVLFLATATGCAGVWSTVAYWKHGQRMPAEYAGLEGQRVAVVCVADGSSYGTGSESTILAREVSSILRQNIEEIELIRPDEIADWIDREGWDEIDYREIGRGVKADQVVAIDLAGFRLYEGSSLYNGRAHLEVTVYDMQDGGREAYRKTIPEYHFPATGPRPVGDISEVQFRHAFLRAIAEEIAKRFYNYETLNDFGQDSAFIGA